jgi:tRNA (guanine26-N2/guanine27-N2)-dimethyltransferase
MFQVITEGSAKIKVSKETKISKKLPVFYNPLMKFNRDISILLLNTLNKKDVQLALPLAGTGIRGIRFAQELKKGIIKTLFLNDKQDNFYEIIRDNFALNKLPDTTIILSNEDANLFMLKNNGFDYIDIDPFGSPNPFLDAAIVRLARGGILAVTATDTSALCGTYENACKRKYWAKPLRNELKHEIGVRILIRKIQLVASQHEKALTPIFSYSKDHYFKVFFMCEKGKLKANEVIKQHGFLGESGPMWQGLLWDKKLVAKMMKNSEGEMKDFLTLIHEEATIGTVGFYDIHKLCEREKLESPRFEALMNKIKEKGYLVSRTHFLDVGLRSNIRKEELIILIKTV